MEFLPIEQPASAANPNSLTADDIRAMCQRAFGSDAQILSVRELGGGTFNTTFLITLADQQVILRIAPPPTAELEWHEQWLMRREQNIQPFFASLGTLMPRTLMADFTHQVVPRDYVFQTYLVGERWEDIADSLAPEEELALWDQFGRITKTIHSTAGKTFGGPHPMPEFPTWSQTILDRLERTIRAMTEARLELTDIHVVLEIVQKNTALLDRIQQPHLLHGDLWLFNLLIQRSPTEPNIVGVLDADRAWWGDPLADWTMFVLAMSASPETQQFHERFWQAYGGRTQTAGTVFRIKVYEALHVGTALVWAIRHQDHDTVARGKRDLSEIATLLPTLL